MGARLGNGWFIGGHLHALLAKQLAGVVVELQVFVGVRGVEEGERRIGVLMKTSVLQVVEQSRNEFSGERYDQCVGDDR